MAHNDSRENKKPLKTPPHSFASPAKWGGAEKVDMS